MTVVLMADPATGRVALYDEAPGGGDPADPIRLDRINAPHPDVGDGGAFKFR